jgi:hypothetical protein
MSKSIPTEQELVDQFRRGHTTEEYLVFEAIQAADPLNVIYSRGSQVAEYLVYMDLILAFLKPKRSISIDQLARALWVIMYFEGEYSLIRSLARKVALVVKN